MIITDTARDFLLELLEQEEKNCLTIDIQGQGCHSQLFLDFVQVEWAPYEINGLKIIMSDETAEALEGITLDANGNGLVFRSDCACGGGCCGDCGDGCGDCCDGCED